MNENADGNEITVQASVLSDKRITRKCGVVQHTVRVELEAIAVAPDGEPSYHSNIT